MDIGITVTLGAVAFTVFAFVVNWLRQSIIKSDKEIRVMEKSLDGHMLHVSNNYSTKDEVVKMIGLISSPIQKSVEDLKDQMKENKKENKHELEKICDKLDDILAQQGNRREHD